MCCLAVLAGRASRRQQEGQARRQVHVRQAIVVPQRQDCSTRALNDHAELSDVVVKIEHTELMSAGWRRFS